MPCFKGKKESFRVNAEHLLLIQRWTHFRSKKRLVSFVYWDAFSRQTTALTKKLDNVSISATERIVKNQ